MWNDLVDMCVNRSARWQSDAKPKGVPKGTTASLLFGFIIAFVIMADGGSLWCFTDAVTTPMVV